MSILAAFVLLSDTKVSDKIDFVEYTNRVNGIHSMAKGEYTMRRDQLRAVEILPGPLSEYVIGSTKNTTCRVMKNGRNVAMPKVKQPNKTGGKSLYLQNGAAKWRTMNLDQKEYWREIAKEHDFWSNWTAFMSSFLKSVTIYGLDYVMANEVEYVSSDARFERQKCHENSVKRNRQYQPDPESYPLTEATLKTYPVAMDSALIYVKLLDVIDVNNAMLCKLLYRTDPFVEYQYFPNETGEIEKGYYIKSQRPRQDDELYELFDSV